eukprot:gene38772-47885_t
MITTRSARHSVSRDLSGVSGLLRPTSIDECREAIARWVKNDFTFESVQLQDLTILQYQDMYVVARGAEKPTFPDPMPRNALELVKRIVSVIFWKKHERSTDLMDLVSDGAYSRDASGSAPLVCYLLLNDPRPVGSAEPCPNVATLLNNRLILCKGGEETPEHIAIRFGSKRRAFSSADSGSSKRAARSASVPEDSLARLCPNTPNELA